MQEIVSMGLDTNLNNSKEGGQDGS